MNKDKSKGKLGNMSNLFQVLGSLDCLPSQPRSCVGYNLAMAPWMLSRKDLRVLLHCSIILLFSLSTIFNTLSSLVS